jgi:hypothetical protein
LHPDNLGRQFKEFKFIIHPDFDFPDYDDDEPFTDGEMSLKPKK